MLRDWIHRPERERILGLTGLLRNRVVAGGCSISSYILSLFLYSFSLREQEKERDLHIM